mgnify:CR=1 FL=1|jgi:preprotein translocase subunit YajC
MANILPLLAIFAVFYLAVWTYEEQRREGDL